MPALLRHPGAASVAPRPDADGAPHRVYYDTPDCAARGGGHRAARCGATARRWVQTIKGPPDAAGGGGLQRARRARMAGAGAGARPGAALPRRPWRKLIATRGRSAASSALHDRLRAADDTARVSRRHARAAVRRPRRDPGGARRPHAPRADRGNRDRARDRAPRPTCSASRSRSPPTCRSRS